MARKHYKGSEEFIPGSKVEVRNNDFNRAFRRFKKKIQDDGILQELRERQHFEKPSIKRKKSKSGCSFSLAKKTCKRSC